MELQLLPPIGLANDSVHNVSVWIYDNLLTEISTFKRCQNMK